MNLRSTLIVISSIACAATVAGLVMQGRQLGDLRAEHQRLLILQEGASENSAAPGVIVQGQASSGTPSLELLRLRNEVNQLTKRRREFENVDKENERLQVQVAITRTNKSAATALAVPPGYLHKSSARNLGFSSPEATIETMLWAIENRDQATLLQVFEPNAQQKFQKEMSKKSVEEFWKGSEKMPPIRIVSREQLPDGVIQLEMAMGDGTDSVQKIKFQQVDGQWRMQDPH